MAPPVLTIVLPATLILAIWSPVFLWAPAAYLVGLMAAASQRLPTAGFAALGVPVALATMHLSWGLGFLAGQTSSR
jgi:hypothetical protein